MITEKKAGWQYQKWKENLAKEYINKILLLRGNSSSHQKLKIILIAKRNLPT